MLHITELLPLPNDTPFGNLMAIYTQLIQLRKHLESKINNINATYKKRTSRFADMSIVFEINEFVTSTKTLIDGKLSIFYLLKSKKDTGVWPQKLDIDCIGGYLNASKQGTVKDFDADLSMLIALNDAGNALKHSLVNYETTMIGSSSPLCCALYMKNNDSDKGIQLVKVNINDIWNVAKRVGSQVHISIPLFK